MDFAKINPAKNAEVPATLDLMYQGETVTLNGDESKPIEISLYGTEGETGRRAAARAAKARAARTKGRRTTDLARMSEDQILSMEQAGAKINAKFYADLTAGWNNMPDLAGGPDEEGNYKVLAFSTEAAVKIYTENPWIGAEIDNFLADPLNFANVEESV